MADDTEKNESEQEEKAVYELGYHLVGTTPTDAVGGAVSDIKAKIEKHGGGFISEEFPQMIRLAYTIVRRSAGKSEKHDMAHFGSIKFEMMPSEVLKLKDDLEGESGILRFLITRTVREDTRAPRRASGTERKASLPENIDAGEREPVREKPDVKRGEPMTEEELDKTIEELVKE